MKDDYDLTGVARRPMEGLRHFRASIHNLQEILPAFAGQDAVVHLAADADKYATWDSVLYNNIVGTYNVFEACRIHKIRRVVFASSNRVTGMYERDHPYDYIARGEYDKVDVWPVPRLSSTSEIRPDGYYGISKAYGEAMGRYYWEEHGISVICLRLGVVNACDTPAPSIRLFAVWLSHRDVAQLVRRSLEAPNEVGFAIFYGASDNKWRFWDIDPARQTIGFLPQDNAETYR